MPARSVGPSTSVSSVAGGRASSSFYRQREDSRQITVHWSGRPRGVTFDATLGLDVRPRPRSRSPADLVQDVIR